MLYIHAVLLQVAQAKGFLPFPCYWAFHMSIAIPLEPPSLSLFPSELLLSSKASLPSF